MAQQQILEQARDNEWIKFENGLRKFRCGKFVIYDVDYLLKNLAEEISKLSAEKTVSKPMADYVQGEHCSNPYAWGNICAKCGACGRRFDKRGVICNE